MTGCTGNSKAVTSQQDCISDKLQALTERYRSRDHMKPLSQHSLHTFAKINDWLAQRDGAVILDACCGVGESTAHLASLYPTARVIGIDKSDVRLSKHAHYAANRDNYQVFRADIQDMLVLMTREQWRLAAQFWWYPNPYPNKHQVQKRWHASPTMPHIMGLGGDIEVRSNWRLYLEEFAWVAQQYGRKTTIEEILSDKPVTPFERKYRASHQSCWKLSVRT
jgi:tRNA G46 methylase TrmB